MKKTIFGLSCILVLVLASVLVVAESSSSMRRIFVVDEDAVSDGEVFSSPDSVQEVDSFDVLIFVIGVIAIIIVIYLIVKKWLGKKTGARKGGRRRRKK